MVKTEQSEMAEIYARSNEIWDRCLRLADIERRDHMRLLTMQCRVRNERRWSRILRRRRMRKTHLLHKRKYKLHNCQNDASKQTNDSA